MGYDVDDTVVDLVDETKSLSTQDKLDDLDMIDSSFD
jgi:hypothetical protein